MQRRHAIQNILGAGALAASAAPAADGWSNDFARQLLDDFRAHWASTKDYSLDVVDAMPEDRYDFKPSPEQRTFAEQSVHFCSANAGYFSRFGKGPERPRPPKELTKDAVRDFLIESFDYVDGILASLTEQDFSRRDIEMGFNAPKHTAQDIFLRAYMHTVHHRGQIVVYLRLQAIEPPAWRFPPQGA